MGQGSRTSIWASAVRLPSVFFYLVLGTLLVIGLLITARAMLTLNAAQRLALVNITVSSDTSLPKDVQALETASANYAFDRDTTTEHSVFGLGSLTATLNTTTDLQAIAIYGDAPYEITVDAWVGGGWTTLPGLKNESLANNTPDAWQRYELSGINTNQLRFQLDPIKSKGKSKSTTATGLKEIALWGGSQVPVNQAAAVDVTANQLSPSLIKFTAGEAEGVVSPTNGRRFTVTLDREPHAFTRAWLVYETYGYEHWMAPVRAINGSAALGGEVRLTKREWTTSAEPIHPDVLIKGSNSIDFGLSVDARGAYTVRNVRLVAEHDTGINLIESATVNEQPAKVLDHNTGTGWALTGTGKPTLELHLNRSAQLDAVWLHLSQEIDGSLSLDYLSDDKWKAANIPTLNGKKLSPGWNHWDTQGLPATNALRIVLQNGSGNATVQEVAVQGLQVGPRHPATIQVGYPDAGQYFGRTAFIRGYLSQPTHNDGEVQLFAGGKPVPQTHGGFEVNITKDEIGLEDQNDSDPWQATLEAVYPDGTRIEQIVQLNNGDSSAQASSALPTAAALGIHGRGRHLKLDGAELVVDPDATDDADKIKIKGLKADELPPLDPGMTNVTRGPHAGYRFTPHGMKFKKKIQVTLPFDSNKVPKGLTDHDIQTFYFDTERGHWITLEKHKLNSEKQDLTSLTDHFTDMINATLTAPDNPQAVNFNPTQIKDIKAADPGAEINLIGAPQANNMGDARLSYPLQLPPGRAGLQPQLTIEYNSSGGNGWLGKGWDLSMPSISIDTRWGVPRYTAGKETETYMFNGQQLSPVAHRGDLIARTENTTTYNGETVKIFHTRVEGGFQKIIRHGASPSTYWWEVIEKNGTRNLYGGGPDTNGPTTNSTLQDKNNNVFKWALRKTIDTNGNTVTYKCKRVCDTGVKQANGTYTCGGTGVAGYQLYVDEIFYTGHGTDKGAYSVLFTRDDELNETRRPDVTIDGRGGFKQVTAARLRKVVIKYQEELVRRYELNYETGPFEKSLLTLVTQFDDKGKPFNKHKFDYYNDIKTGETYNAFNDPVQWTTGDDNSGFPLIEGAAEYSALGATQGEAGGGSFSLGFAPFPTKYLSFNAMVGSNTSTSQGRLSFIDIDGDGLPDKVWGNNSFQYRKNTVTPDTPFDEDVSFANASETINGLGSLSDENSQSFNGGGQVYVFGVNIVKDYSYSMTTTNKYLSDVNGDGLIDLVDSGTVKFNKKFDSDDTVKFSSLSEGSLYPIGAGAVNTENLLPEEAFADAEARALEQNPLADAVRRWRAPFAGTIEIKGNVQLVNVLEDNRFSPKEKEDRQDYKTADGVRVAIEKNGESDPRWSQEILEDDFSIYGPGGAAGSSISVDVAKGDIIYFRVHSRFDGAYDEVKWSPVISYTETQEAANAGSQLTGVNSFNPYEYVAANEFAYGGRTTPVDLPFKGTIRIEGSFSKTAVTTDDVSLSIYKIPADEYEGLFNNRRDFHLLHQLKEPIYQAEVKSHEVGDLAIDGLADFEVNRSDKLFVIINVDSNIDLSHVKWNDDNPLSIFYTKAYAHEETPAPLDENGNPTDPLGDGWEPGEELTVKDANGDYLIKPYPIYDINYYPDNALTIAQKDWEGPEMGWLLVEPRVTPKPKVVGNDPIAKPVLDHNSEMVFTTKQRGKLLKKSVMTLLADSKYRPQQYSFAIPVPKGDKYFFDLSTRDPELAATLESTSVSTHFIRPQYTVSLSGVPLNQGASTKQWNSPQATVTVLPQIRFKANAAPVTGDVILQVSHDVEDVDGNKTKELVVRRPIKLDTTKPFNPYDHAFDVVNTTSTTVYFSFTSSNNELVSQIQAATLKLAVGTNHSRSEKEFDSLTLFLEGEATDEDDSGKVIIPVTSSGKLAVAPDLNRAGSRDFDFDSELSVVTKRRHTPLDDEGKPKEDDNGNVIVITQEINRYTFQVHSGERYNPGKHTFDVPVAYDASTEQDVSLILYYETADTALSGRGLTYNLWTQFRRHSGGYTVPSWTPPHMLHRQGFFDFFVSPYRGWSYGGYNANKEVINEDTGEEKDYGQLVIDAERFNLSNNVDDYSVPTNYQDQLDRANETDMKNQTAFPAVPQPEQSRWFIGDPRWWVTSNYISSSRMGLDYIRFMRNDDLDSELPPTGPTGGGGATGVPRLSIVDGQDTTGVGFYVSISNSTTPVKGLLDYMDLNGDRFPDVVGGGRVQYTDMTGGLGATTGGFGGETRESSSVATNIAPGGTVPNTAANGKGETNGSPAKSDKPSQNSNYGFTGSLGFRDDTTDSAFRDVNGDGLPDRVTQNSSGEIRVQLNVGYGFEAPELWGIAPLSNSHSEFVNAGLSYNDGVKGYAGSITVTRTLADVVETMADVNGDGLPDRIRQRGNGLLVNMNTGTGFTGDVPFASAASLGFKPGYNQSFSFNGGGSFNITLGPLCLVICYADINPGFNFSTNMGRTEIMVQDINGDGYADYLSSTDDNKISVSLNLRRRTNLLKSVSRPLAGTIDISYKRTGNTFDLPQSRWVMDKVTVFDGVKDAVNGEGADFRVTTYDYKEGYHNRFERDFYGFKTVEETHLDTSDLTWGQLDTAKPYRRTKRTYFTDSYYRKGLLDEERTDGISDSGNLIPYLKTDNTYEMRDVETFESVKKPATTFPALTDTVKTFYESGTGTITTTTTFDYDSYGNVTNFTDYGNDGDDTDNVEARIAYTADDTSCVDHYIVGKALSIKVYEQGDLVRHRSGEFDCDNNGRGNLRFHKQHIVYESGSLSSQYVNDNIAVTELTYDQYGNVETETGPLSKTGEQIELKYAYDDFVHTYANRIDNLSYKYYSEARYDYKWGKTKWTEDVNRNRLSYSYDSKGRTKTITGPYEAVQGETTISFTYGPYVELKDRMQSGAPAYGMPSWSKTYHFDKDWQDKSKNNTIDTVLLIDGRKQILQTKKDASIDGIDEMMVSGRVVFDGLGRTVKQYYPTTEAKGSNTNFKEKEDTTAATVMRYDVLDRNRYTKIPSGAETFIDYVIDGSRFKTMVTDAETNKKETYRDVRQLITQVREFNPGTAGQNVLVSYYTYDALKQITHVTDAKGNITKVKYDQFGRRTVIDNPDTGKVETGYDLAGNTIAKLTANLRGTGTQASTPIEYDYDHTRLVTVRYPQYTERNITYRYGDDTPQSRIDGQVGRVVDVTHESGSEQRFYGKLGETVKEVKTVASETQGSSNNSPEVYTTEYFYDTFGRLLTLDYDDGEQLRHTYDAGGNIARIEGAKRGDHQVYLDTLHYDKFEQRSYIKYGNGVETTYTYRPDNRRLRFLDSVLPAGRQFQKFDYTYDKVGNITDLVNNVTTPPNKELGGPAEQHFVYDNLYRLTSASGEYEYAPNKLHKYNLAMSYDAIHNIKTKKQEHNRIQGANTIPQKGTSYDWTYDYNNSGEGSYQPHAPRHIGTIDADDNILGRKFDYDANGNQTGWAHDKNSTRRNIIWDEDNRIRQIDDNGQSTRFKYDDQGQRVFKIGKQGETAYINQFYTVRNRSIASKHVYAGTTRIVTKLVSGNGNTRTDKPGRNADTGQNTVGNGNAYGHDKDKKGNGNAYGHDKQKQKGAKGVPFTQGHPGKGLENRSSKSKGKNAEKNPHLSGSHPGRGLENRSDRANEVAQNTEKNPHLVDQTPTDPDDGSPGGSAWKPEENFLYYYHADHLGSTGYVTDKDGALYEHIEYFPFGETWIQEATNTERTPYLFTGKELDQETGLYYFGARYYDPRTSVWQSADPIIGRYLDGSPAGGVFMPSNLGLYSYGAQNPVRFKDDDGEFLNFVVGAAVGFVSDVAFQAAVQIASGKGLSDVNINWTEAGVSAALGATGVGVANVVAKGAKALKSAKALRKAASARGRASEARVLKKMGLKSNKSTKVKTSEGNSVPDGLTKKLSVEVKDTKSVSLTKQLRIQTEAAKQSGRKSILVTGKNTKVSGPAKKAFDQIIRDKSLGPQPLLSRGQAAAVGAASGTESGIVHELNKE